MRLGTRVRLRLRSLGCRGTVERELEEELRYHLDREAEGAGAAEALRRFAAGGNVDAVREACREQRGTVWLENLVQDARRSVRRLRATPAFSLTAVLVMGLGLAAAVAMFSLYDAVLLRPLPGTAAGGGLVHLERWDGHTLLGDLSYPDFLDYKSQTLVFAALAASSHSELDIAAPGVVVETDAEFVSDNYFPLLGVKAEAGRLLGAGDEAVGQNRVAVLSDSVWRSQFAARASVVGSAITINRAPFTVIGVAGPGFQGDSRASTADLWVPISNQPLLESGNDCYANRNCGWITALGRLAPGLSRARAQAELDTVAARIGAAHPLEKDRRAEVVAGLGSWSDDRTSQRQFLEVLLAGTLLLLAMASASVGSLFLARLGARQREVATQLALGAGRARIAQGFLLEGAAVTGAGLGLGVALAPGLARGLLALAPMAPQNLASGLDWRGLGFAGLAGAVAVAILSWAPAWLAARSGMVAGLRQGSGASARHRAQRGMLAVQLGLALLLLIAAGLAGRTLEAATRGAVPSQADRITMAFLNTKRQGYSRTQAAALFDRLQQRLAAQPGIQSVALAACIPPSPCNRGPVFVAGTEPTVEVMRYRESSYAVRPDINWVGPGFLGMMDMPLRAGRDFGVGDRLSSPKVCIINQRLAAALWPHGTALGQRISWPSYYRLGTHEDFTVVGIIADRRTDSLTEAAKEQMYVPAAQVPFPSTWIVMRGELPAVAQAAMLRQQTEKLDSTLAPTHRRSLADQVRRSLWQPLALASLGGGFGGLAALLAAIGLFGTVCQQVRERRRELGIRLALGARPGQLVGGVVGDSVAPILWGLAGGAAAAMAGMRWLRPWLWGVTSSDAAAWSGAAALLSVVALAATWAAARRAARVEPMEALGCE